MKRILYSTLLIFISKSFSGEPTILFEHDPTLLVSYINVVVLTGAKDDPREKAGATNLLSELILRGTKKRNRSKFQNELEKMGASLGGSTALDMMFFDGKVIKENTSQFLTLLEDALLRPTLAPAELENLKTEQLAAINHIKNQNNRLGGLAMRRVLFKDTPLERQVIGSLSSIKGIKREDLLRVYNDSFHQANVIFAVASPLEEKEIKKMLMPIWKGLPDGARKGEVVYSAKVPEKPMVVVIHKPKTSTGAMMFAQSGITARDPLRYVLNTANFSFGSEPLVSRLFRTIRGELGWTYAIGSSYGAFGSLSRQPGVFVINSTPAIEFTTKTLFKTLEMWKEFLQEGLTSDEVKLAKESLINSYPFEFESAPKRLGQRLHHFLYGIDLLSMEEYEKKIEAIDNSEIKKALKARHQSDGWLIAVVADKDVLAAQLDEYQKDIPEEKRVRISKVYLPEELVE